MTNRNLAQASLSMIYSYGVRDVIICPGARCAPLLFALEQVSDFRIQTHFDERSAGFYALGLIQNLGRPVAIVTTSGTAVSELMSAVVEANYNELPLIVVSTDRPKSYRGSGAPQTIEQSEIFSKFVEFSLDEDEHSFKIPLWSQKKPIHFNLCFDEPLKTPAPEIQIVPIEVPPLPKIATPSLESFNSALFVDPLVIVSGSYGFPQDLVRASLRDLNLPIYCEATSGLKGHKDFQKNEIFFPENLIKENKIKSVIRIGHVPTTRLWRDLENTKLPVLNISHKSFSGLSYADTPIPLNGESLSLLKGINHSQLSSLVADDLGKKDRLLSAIEEFPNSEPSLLFRLKSFWEEGHLVFLGNSLPIREWDLISCDGVCFEKVSATRGANGIDGQISTFYGLSRNSITPTLAVVGDLTALYDLNAPWVLGENTTPNFVAIINNSGGKIFDRMFKSPLFQNSHHLQFKHWASMWNLPYTKFDGTTSPFLSHGGVIEIFPEDDQTKAFWNLLS